MLDMAKQDIIPSLSDYTAKLGVNLSAKQSAVSGVASLAETTLITELAELNDKLFAATRKLESDLKKIDNDNVKEASQAMAHIIIPDMENVRDAADEAEKLTASEYWPYPSYSDMLYRVK